MWVRSASPQRSFPNLESFSIVLVLSLCVVLCHRSPRQISLAFGKHPSYLVGDPYICATALYEPCYSSLPSPTLLTSTFCFWPTFAYTRAEPPKPHHWLICNRKIYHVCPSRIQAQPCGSITSETSHGMWWKLRQWRLKMEAKFHWETIGVPLMENVFKHTIRFTWMYPPSLTSTLASKGLRSWIWKVLLKSIHRLLRDFHTTRPLTLLQKSSWHLRPPSQRSIPNSWIIYLSLHLDSSTASQIHPKRMYWPKLSLCVLSAFWFMVLPVASLLSVKRVSLSS